MSHHYHGRVYANALGLAQRQHQERDHINHNKFSNAIVDNYFIGRLLLESREWLLFFIPRKN